MPLHARGLSGRWGLLKGVEVEELDDIEEGDLAVAFVGREDEGARLEGQVNVQAFEDLEKYGLLHLALFV